MSKALKLVIFIWVLIGAGNRPVTAQALVPGRGLEGSFSVLDKIFKEFAEQNHFPGLIYGIVDNGKLIHTASVGYPDLEKKNQVTVQSEFRIASMTKSFTAMAVLQLRDQGKLKLDEPVYLYVPELKDQKYPSSDAVPLTIRNLLTHSAGLPEDNPWGDRQLDMKEDEFMAMLKKGLSFSSDPGLQYEYSNTGYAILGEIIKNITGEPYHEYITKHILQPLGMTHTYWEYTEVPADQLAQGYRWLNGQWVKQPLLHDGVYGAMGGMITSMDDFVKYMSLHLGAWPPRNEAETGPLRRSSVREMHQPWTFNNLNTKFRYSGGTVCPLVLSYGYGLRWTYDCKGRTMISHSGGLPGYGSNWTILPDYGIGIVCFANRTYAPAGEINTRALDTLLSLTGLQPVRKPVPGILEQRKNELTRLLPGWDNAASSGIFAENFFMDYFAGSLRKEAADIFSKAGKISRVGEMVAENNLRGYYIIECDRQNIRVSFTLTPENPALIQEYHISLVPKNTGSAGKK